LGIVPLKHHHHRAWIEAIGELQHRRMMAREGDLAPVGQPIHHRVQIPEVFQLWSVVVLPPALLLGPLQGPLQGRRLRWIARRALVLAA